MNVLKGLFLVFVFFSTKLWTQNFEKIEDQCTLRILTPSLNDRKTAKIRLNNGLEVLLISDPKTTQSAAGMCVGVGYWHDPKEFPGMAHFLEHMLFLGTETYPQENAYHTFISDAGGRVNAFTLSDRTVYIFSVNNEAFTGALDRFAHSFIDPLLGENCIERELHAIDQEYAKNVQNDSWRKYMVFKATCNPLHPMAKFSTGNHDTLGLMPYTQMRNWFQTHYVASKMHLALISPLSIQEMIEQTVSRFSKIPAQKEAPQFLIPPFITTHEQCGHFIFIKPVKTLKTLSLVWELSPEFAKDQERKVVELTASILRNRSANSLFEQLKKEQLIEILNVSVDRVSKQHALFSIDIELSENGLQKYQMVIERVFQMFARLKKEGIPFFLFEEFKKMRDWQYQYQTRSQPFSYIADEAESLMDEDLATYPLKLQSVIDYDADFMASFIASLTPESCIYFVTADPSKTHITPNARESWSGAEYLIRPVDAEQLQAWHLASPHPGMGLPANNPFIPEQLNVHTKTIKSEEMIAPRLIMDDAVATVYFAEDHTYLIPEMCAIFRFKSPLIDGTAKSTALTDLFIKAAFDKHTSFLEQAKAANLYARFYLRHMALHWTMSGYSGKAHLFIKEMLKSVKKLKPTLEEFERYKSALLINYENQSAEMPFNQALAAMENALFNDAPAKQEKIDALQAITYEEFSQFIIQLFKKGSIESLLYGNLTLKEAQAISEEVKTQLKLLPYAVDKHKKRNVLQLGENQGPFMIRNKTLMQGHAALLSINFGQANMEKKVSHLLLTRILQAGFFDTLRTKQQTGYITHTWDSEEEHQLLHYFGVQSNTHHPLELIARFELFLENLLKQFSEEVSEERFDQLKATLLTTLIQKKTPPEMNGMAGQLFQLGFDEKNFTLLDDQIESLKKLDYFTFAELSRQFLSRHNRKRIAMLIEGNVPLENNFYYKVVRREELYETHHTNN